MRGKVEQRCDDHPDPFDCPDNVVRYNHRLREYGLIIHDGGSASYHIQYCPWCGTRLPESRRDELYPDEPNADSTPTQGDVTQQMTLAEEA